MDAFYDFSIFSVISKPPELGVAADLSVQEVEEGSEPDSFWKTLTSSKSVTSEEVERMRRMYDSLLEGIHDWDINPRVETALY